MSDVNGFNNGSPYYQPGGNQPEQKGQSIASLVLGLCGLVAWCIPLFGYPVSIIGLIMGILGSKKGGKGMAIAGIILSVICLIATLINSVLGAMQAVGSLNL